MLMTSRSRILALGTAALAASGLLVLASLPNSAEAAISVIGPGPAETCYDAAENGRDASDYIIYCTHDRAATYINRGVLKLSLSMTNDALADFDAGLALDPALGEGYIDRGASLIAKRRFADAIESIDKGLSLGAKHPNIAYYDRAIADEALGDIQGAYKDYRQALELAPDFALASEELKRFKVVKKNEGS